MTTVQSDNIRRETHDVEVEKFTSAAVAWFGCEDENLCTQIALYARHSCLMERHRLAAISAEKHREKFKLEYLIQWVEKFKSRNDTRMAELIQTNSDDWIVLARLWEIQRLLERYERGFELLMDLPTVRANEYAAAIEKNEEAFNRSDSSWKIASRERNKARIEIETYGMSLANKVRKRIDRMLDADFGEFELLKIEAPPLAQTD